MHHGSTSYCLASDGIVINFAWRTFIWNNEAAEKAHVHCVIVGFSRDDSTPKYIYDGDDNRTEVSHINGYLIDAIDVFIDSRSKALCEVPEISIGNQPIDDGNYIFTQEEADEFIEKEPKARAYFRPLFGATEFLKGTKRFCLWLGDCNPVDLIKMPLCLDRVKKVKEFRSKSNRTSTKKLAERPTHFQVESMPDTDFILVPRHSSENRAYIPMGFMRPDAIATDATLIIPNAKLFHFGVLESSVHMSWMRVVAGRIKSDYRYSKDIVYNNFVWPEADDAMKQKISKTAQGILDARAKYPEATLGQMYSNLDLFTDPKRAHQANDKAVLEAYGLKADTSESDIVAHLFRLYEEKAGA